MCLTEETVEALYLMGEDHRIVGVTGYAVRPPRVRREKPRVGAFTSADVLKIVALEPDLVLTFSDLQAEIAAELLRAGISVHGFNQRDLPGIFAMIETLGALIGEPEKGHALAVDLRARTQALRQSPTIRQKVYFEEWDEPMISGLAWVSDLVHLAGGEDVFPDLAREKAAKDRFVTSEQVIAAAPDVIIASWCGKKVRPEKIAARPGWDTIPAVRDNRIYEVKSPLILSPGPAALTDGLDQLIEILT